MGKSKPYLSHTAQQRLIGLLLIAIGLAVYQYAFTLPLFWDDIFQFAWLQQVNTTQVLTTPVAGLNYYRPAALLVWKVANELQRGFDPLT